MSAARTRRTTRPAPPLRIDVTTGPTFTALHARALLLLAAVALLGIALRHATALPEATWVLAAVGGLLVALFPATLAPHLAIAVAGLGLFGSAVPFDPVALALVLLAHLVLRLSWWSAHVPFEARAELRAVVPDARRLVLIQLAVQVLGVGLLLLSAGPGVPLVAAAGGVCVLALTLLVLPRD